MFLEEFRRMGSALNEAWTRADRSAMALPAIAADALRRLDVWRGMDVPALIEELLRTSEWCGQFGGPSFGQPPATVYNSRDLVVDLYFWTNPSPGLHNHPFVGAFTILAGKSVHEVATFETGLEISHRFAFGKVTQTKLEVLGPGDVRQFGYPDPLIHRLIHVDVPSVSMVVRSGGKLLPDNYYSYRASGFRLPGNHGEDQFIDRRTRLLELLLQVDKRRLDSILDRYLEENDFEAVFALLRHPSFARYVPTVLAALSARFPELRNFGEVVEADFEEKRGQDELRALVTSDLRLVAVLLWLSRDEDVLSSALQAARPTQTPEHLLHSFVQHVLSTSAPPRAGLTAAESNKVATASTASSILSQGLEHLALDLTKTILRARRSQRDPQVDIPALARARNVSAEALQEVTEQLLQCPFFTSPGSAPRRRATPQTRATP